MTTPDRGRHGLGIRNVHSGARPGFPRPRIPDVEAHRAGRFSRNPKDFSRVIDREFRRLDIEVVPVHPSTPEVDGRRCFPSVTDIAPPVDGAFILVPAAKAEAVALDCLDAGVRRIWFHRGGGPGSASSAALALCSERGVRPISDLCPFMVISDAGWPHRLHGWLRRRKLSKGP